MNYIHSFWKHIRHDKNPVVKRRCLMFYLVCFVWLDFREANVETFYIPGLPIQVHISQKLSQCIIVGFQGGKQRKGTVTYTDGFFFSVCRDSGGWKIRPESRIHTSTCTCTMFSSIALRGSGWKMHTISPLTGFSAHMSLGIGWVLLGGCCFDQHDGSSNRPVQTASFRLLQNQV